MGDPLQLLKESNRRRRSKRVESPLDLIRVLNMERRRREATRRVLERVVGR